jgi:hypothetical protein
MLIVGSASLLGGGKEGLSKEGGGGGGLKLSDGSEGPGPAVKKPGVSIMSSMAGIDVGIEGGMEGGIGEVSICRVGSESISKLDPLLSIMAGKGFNEGSFTLH